MRYIPLTELQDSLSQYLHMAEEEDIIITQHGVPACMLIGFQNSDNWWEELLLRHPLFKARIAQSRQQLREGQGTTIEQLRDEFATESEEFEQEVTATADEQEVATFLSSRKDVKETISLADIKQEFGLS